MSEIGKIVRKRWRRLTEPLNKSVNEVVRFMVTYKRLDATIRRIDAIELEFEMHRRETRTLHRSKEQPPYDLWRGQPPVIAGGPADDAFPHSTFCREDDFRQPYFSHWSVSIGNRPRYHRKLWEFVYICQSLWERGVLTPGHRGLGFGVGDEALPALFASHGCDVVATDLAPDGAAAIGWIETAQHANGRDGLRRPEICPDEVFDQRVSFEACDMNAIPDHLRDFDFCWSSCAFEHLGSIERGLEFIENSLACLKPGGWAVHTTEYNVFSNDETVDGGGTVLFRRRDFEALARRLETKGHKVAPLSFEPGEGLIDGYVDVAPYCSELSLNIAMLGHVTTSFGIIVQRAPAERSRPLFADTSWDERSQVLTWLASPHFSERRHAIYVLRAWLSDGSMVADSALESLRQALLDAALVEPAPHLLELELATVAESTAPIANLLSLRRLLDRLPTLEFDAACHVLDLLQRNGDSSLAAPLAAIQGLPGFPRDRKARVVSFLRALDRMRPTQAGASIAREYWR